MNAQRQVAAALVVAAFIWLFPKVALVGDIWDYRVNPRLAVEVELLSGFKGKGALTRDWFGNYELVQPDGSSLYFDKDGFASMSWPIPPQVVHQDWFTKHWRAMVLPLLLGFGTIVALVTLYVPWLPSRSS
jgi:hypothetical protein